MRTIVFWTWRLVDSFSISAEPWLSVHRPRVVLPIGEMAAQARREWEWVRALWHAADYHYHPEAIPPLDRLLWEVSRRWELRWALLLRDAERSDGLSLPERMEVENCDRTWSSVIRHDLEPHGYQLLPDTMARLL